MNDAPLTEADKLVRDKVLKSGLTGFEWSAVKVLLQFHEETKSESDKLPERMKAFVEAAKAFSMFAGAGVTGLNMFGATIAYMSKKVFNANAGSSSSTPAPVNPVQEWMVIGTFLIFLYTCLTAATAHATVHRAHWVKKLQDMVYLEIFLVAAVCGLYIYMLTEDINVAIVIWCTVLFSIYIVTLTDYLFFWNQLEVKNQDIF